MDNWEKRIIKSEKIASRYFSNIADYIDLPNESDLLRDIVQPGNENTALSIEANSEAINACDDSEQSIDYERKYDDFFDHDIARGIDGIILRLSYKAAECGPDTRISIIFISRLSRIMAMFADVMTIADKGLRRAIAKRLKAAVSDLQSVLNATQGADAHYEGELEEIGHIAENILRFLKLTVRQ